jgi:hypothetical protein
MRRWTVIIACWTEWYACSRCRPIFLIVLSLSLSLSLNERCGILFLQGNDMDSSRGVLSGTMDRFKMVCTRNNILPIPINIDPSAIHHLFFSFVVFPICLIYFRIKHVLLLGCYDDLVLPCRYSRPSQAGECLHLWHHLL